MRWPDPDSVTKIKKEDIPHDAPILGLAPIGVRWEGVMNHGRIVPNKGCPAREFVPCYALVHGDWKEIECPKT